MMLRHCAAAALPGARFAAASTTRGISGTALADAGLEQDFNYVAGERCAGTGASFANLYPATGQVLCQVNEAGTPELERAIAAAVAAQPIWAETAVLERARVLQRASRGIQRRIAHVAHLETLDTGKPLWESRADIEACCDTMELLGGLAPGLCGEHVHLPGHSFYYTRREALGVVGAIGAWNYPFQMATWKAAPALATGNAVVFKPSPLTPLTAVILAEELTAAGLPPGVFSVVQGGAAVGAALSSHPLLAKVSFTGSVPSGAAVLAAAAPHIRPTTLELGGKSPLLIFEDADLDQAVKGAVMANFLTQGQVCSNGTRVFVQRAIFDAFTQRLKAAVGCLRLGDPLQEDTAIGAMISAEHHERVQGYVQSALSEGASLVCGNEPFENELSEQLRGGFFMRPVVLADCHDNMRVVREEVFGPVLSLLPFDTEDEAVRRANDTPFGLAGGIFTRDVGRAHRVAGLLEAGSLYVNNYNMYPPGIPFGGIKKSGLGRENCAEALKYYTHIKSVYVEGGAIDYPYPYPGEKTGDN